MATGVVDAGASLAGVTVGGSLKGGHSQSGEIRSGGAMGAVKIGGDIVGTSELFTGNITSRGGIASATVRGSLIGGGNGTGSITATGAIGAVKIGGDIIGGSLSSPGIPANSSGYIRGQRIGSLFVGGSIYAGVDTSNSFAVDGSGSVRAVDDIGPIIIKGSLIGSIDDDGNSSDGDFKPVVISARGVAGLGPTAKNDLAIKSIKIGGRMEMAQILAGYDTALSAKNADAQLGPITIGGDLIASSIVAGVAKSTFYFGTGAETKISGAGVKDNLDANGAVSKIASVVIKGSAFGTTATNDTVTFAIAAQQLGKLTIGGATLPLKSGPSNDLFFINALPLGTTRLTTNFFDFHAFEVP